MTEEKIRSRALEVWKRLEELGDVQPGINWVWIHFSGEGAKERAEEACRLIREVHSLRGGLWNSLGSITGPWRNDQTWQYAFRFRGV